ncbi:hypothetical protein BDY24DRAFT_403506 [Mrakia frigida]|uniref:uncharacterized protein n=1 Tax=Mrakia frigida TaxID=29902 RepID=UPI003FCC14EA
MVPGCSLLLAGAVLLSSSVQAIDTIPTDVMDRVRANAIASSSKSWENGTLARAITELDHLSISPFEPDFLPPWSNNESSAALSTLAFDALASKVEEFGFLSLDGSWRTTVNGTNLQLVPDGSAGDPASLGEVVIWANQTGQIFREPGKYSIAAESEAYYITTLAPRTSDGAISHRTDDVQLWSDFMYMVPPFLAYYAAMTSNTTMMKDAYDQCRLYRQYLKTDSGLWKHIQLGRSGQDPMNWGTGNAWAAAGMMRTIAIMRNSPLNSQYTTEQADLQIWIEEIMLGAFSHQLTTGLLHDYPDNRTSFPDASSTALFAATAYRLSAYGLSSRWVPFAEKAYANISAQLQASSDGWLAPVVNPLAWGVRGSESPEGQSFVMLMEAGRRAWRLAGSTNETGPTGPLEEDESQTVPASS